MRARSKVVVSVCVLDSFGRFDKEDKMVKFFLVVSAAFGVFCGMLVFKCTFLHAVIGGGLVLLMGLFGGK